LILLVDDIVALTIWRPQIIVLEFFDDPLNSAR
jgi:hypothetical protein